MHARVRVLIAIALLALAAAVAAPSAQAVTFGSDLSRPANLPFDCGVRPYIGQNILTGATTCTWWSAPLTAASTYVPVGEGRITAVRVRSGANPAPLRITILSSGGGLCCTSRSQSPVFQPTPNAVTTVPIDLPAGAGLDPDRRGSQYNDIVAVSAVGPGTLPVHDFGVHGTFNTSAPAASFLHPEVALGASNTDVGWMDGYEVLLQADWCGTTGIPASQARAAQACPTTPVPAPQPGPGPAPQPGPGPAPNTTPAPASASRLALAGGGRALTLQVSGPTKVTAKLARCVTSRRRPRRTVCTTRATLTARPRAAGAVRIALPRSVGAGRYRVTVTVRGSDAKIVKSLAVEPAGTRARHHQAGRR